MSRPISRMGRFFCRHGRSLPRPRRPWQSRARLLGSGMASAEFWYEFASTYSYPAALRVAALADERGVSLIWRPFLLGPIFIAQGWRDSPFNIYPAKGRYMWRDLERTCGAMGVPLKRPEPFPQPSLLAARVALALDGDERSDFSRRSLSPNSDKACRSAIARLLAHCWPHAASIRRRRSSGPRAPPTRRGSRPNAPARRRSASSVRRVWRPRRRSVLGQRPARTGARLGCAGWPPSQLLIPASPLEQGRLAA